MAEETILVIDDGAEARDFIIDYVLKPNGYRALVADGGKKGLKLAEKHKPDLILLDLQMPGMDGFGVLQRMADLGLNIPVVIVTFHGSEEIAIEVYRLGVRDYVMKPFSVEEMLGAIERALRESRLLREKEVITRRLGRANREIQKQRSELKKLYRLSQSVSTLLDMSELLPTIVDDALEIAEADEGYIYLYQNAHFVCEVYRWSGDGQGGGAVLGSIVDDTIATSMLTKPGPRLLDNDQTPGDATCALYVPMMLGETLVGVLGVKRYTSDLGSFARRQAAMLTILANNAAIALSNATLTRIRPPVDLPPYDEDDEESLWTKTIFVSYSRTDWNDYVKPLVDQVRAAGLQVWVDQSGLEGGQDWLDTIGRALDKSRYMILCISPDALISEYVKIEYRYFIDERKPIFPVVCRPARLPPELRPIQNIPYTQLDQLIEHLKRITRD